MERVAYIQGKDINHSLSEFLSLCTTTDMRQRVILRADVVVCRGISNPVESFAECIRQPLITSSLQKEQLSCAEVTSDIFRMTSRVVASNEASLPAEKFLPLPLPVPLPSDCLPPFYDNLVESLFDTFQYKYILRPQSETSKVDYFRNLLIPHIDSHLSATELTSLISPQQHPYVTDMPGINSSMYYLAKAGSYCELHCEDGDLPSLNLLRCIIPSGYPFAAKTPNGSTPEADASTATPQAQNNVGKLWLFVHDKNKMLDAFHSATKQLPGKQCFHLNHKNVFVTLNFLKKHNLVYTLVTQAPGDLIFIRAGIFHQVININHCFNEAINYGTPAWNVHANFTHLCRCADEKITSISKNCQMMVATKVKSVTVYDCPVNNCVAQFYVKYNLETHMVKIHNHTFSCDVCQKKYRSKLSLQRHPCKNPADGTVRATPLRRTCKVCAVSISDWSAHCRTKKHQNNVSAQRERTPESTLGDEAPLLQPLSPDSMPLSQRLTARVVCPNCTRTFANRGYFKKHHCLQEPRSTASHATRPCPTCGREFSSCTVAHHIKFCNAYSCDGCSKTFSNKKVLRKHTATCERLQTSESTAQTST